MAADASSPNNVHNKKEADCVTHAKKFDDIKRACVQGELRPNASGSSAGSVPEYTLRPIMSYTYCEIPIHHHKPCRSIPK